MSEANPFELEAFKRSPYPFCTGDHKAIGDHVAATGLILRDLPVPAPARALEFGRGCGFLTTLMARAGYDMTVIDIEQRYLDLIDYWAERLHTSVRTVTGEFLTAEFDEPFDVVMFFEAFHHAIDHVALLRKVRGLVRDNGRVVFAGEPIEADFDTPWRVRTDSLAAYCIRRLGWMELGFSEAYFIEALHRTGFYVRRIRYESSTMGSHWVGVPMAGPVDPNTLHLPEAEWHPPETVPFRWTRGRVAMPVPPDGDALRLSVVNHRPAVTPVLLHTEAGVRDWLLKPGEAAELHVEIAGPRVLIDSPSWRPADYGSADTRTLGLAVREIDIAHRPT